MTQCRGMCLHRCYTGSDVDALAVCGTEMTTWSDSKEGAASGACFHSFSSHNIESVSDLVILDQISLVQ